MNFGDNVIPGSRSANFGDNVLPGSRSANFRGNVSPGSRSDGGMSVYDPDESRPGFYQSSVLPHGPYVKRYSSGISPYPLSGRTTVIHSVSGGPFWIVGAIAAIFLFTIMFPLMLL